MTGAWTLRTAVVQLELRPERSLADFLRHLESVVSRAVDQGAELVVLPELASIGLLGAVPRHTSTTATVGLDVRNFLASQWDSIVDGLRTLATRFDVTVLGGSHGRVADDGSLRNTAALARPDGRLELQDKIHLTPQEHAMGMVGGEDLLVTRVGPFGVGVLICADVQFPELSRFLSAQDVDLVLNPSLTWNRRGAFRIRNGANARASENQMYVATSPLIGTSGLPADTPLHAVGQAFVCCPVDKTFGRNDGLVSIAAGESEAVLVVELDRDLLIASREEPEIPGLKHQRPELYEKLRSRIAGG